MQEAIAALSEPGSVSVLNATQHPSFDWFVSKIEFQLNLQNAIKQWEGVEAPPAAPSDATSTTRRSLLSDTRTKCRKPKRGLKAAKKTCRKYKNRAYFGQVIKQVSSILSPDSCCSLCSRTKGCVSWTVKPKSAGREKGCFLRKSGRKTTKTIAGYWSGYILSGKAPTSVPVPAQPAEEVYEAPPTSGDVESGAPDTNFDDFWDQINNGGTGGGSLDPGAANLPPGTAKYRELLDLHWKFYEAQRSGPEPEWNRIPWRHSSHLNDPVTGGLYDAGDLLKLNFPLASSMIHTGHGLVEFRSGCSSSRTPALRMYKWGIKYLLDCLDVGNQWYIGQIGDPRIDHNYWGRAEEQPPMKRPALLYKRNSMPASDLYGSVAAALAQASVVFQKEGDPVFAQQCLDGALELFKWGDGRPGKYSDYYKEQTKIYKSTGGDDSMATAAGWLYRKTGDTSWLEKARSYFSYDKADVYSGWDSLWGSHVAHMISLADRGVQVPGIDEYRRWSNNKYWRAWLQADGFQSIIKTPKGLHYPKWYAFRLTSSSFLHSSNCLQSRNCCSLRPSTLFAQERVGQFGLLDDVRLARLDSGKVHHRRGSEDSSDELRPWPGGLCNWRQRYPLLRDWLGRELAQVCAPCRCLVP